MFGNGSRPKIAHEPILFQVILPHLIVLVVQVMPSSKRWSDYSSDDEDAEKILPPGILSRSIDGVDPGTHEALNNVRAFLSYQHWRVRHRSFPAGYNIRNNCQRPKRVLMPVEASLGIMATFNRIKNVQEKQWVFPIPFRFHTKLWWLRGSRLTSTRYTHTRRDAKQKRHRTCGFELAPNCIQAVGHRKSESATPKTEWGGNFSRSILLWLIFG